MTRPVTKGRASPLWKNFLSYEKMSWTYCMHNQVFLRRFRDPIQVPRISNRVSRIPENYHRVPKIRENWVPRIREIGSLHMHIGYRTFSLKKPWHNHCFRCYMLCNALLHAINVKFGPPSANYSSPLVSQAGYGSAGDCCLVTSVSYATRFSIFTIKFFRFNIKF